MILGIGAGAALVVMLAVWGFSLYTGGDRVAVDGTPVTTKKKDEEAFILNTIAYIVGRPFTGIALDLIGARSTRIRKRIDAAGRPNGMTVESYARLTAGYVVLFGGVSVLMFLTSHIKLAVVCALCMLLNEAVLFTRIRSRQESIQRALPDFLDVLAVTVSAGLSFRHALARVAESMPGPLSDEFLIALRQMALGSARREAFEDLRARNPSPIMGQFVTAILQAEELGAPLSNALQDIALDMRREGAQLAKRQAQRINPRITMITTTLSLPAVMAIVLCAMFFSSTAGFGGVFGG